MTPRRFALLILITVSLMALGCSGDGGGRLAIQSQDDTGGRLTGGFDTGVYSFDDKNNLTAVLIDGPEDNPTQAVVIRMFWKPRAGRTPIDKTATNTTIHYIIFTGDNNSLAGIYSGAGYVYPNSKPGDAALRASVWQASLRLTDKTDGFQDRLGQALVKGGFNARRDDAGVQQAIRKLNILIRERLGFPRLVQHQPMQPHEQPQEIPHASQRIVRFIDSLGHGAARGDDAHGM